MSNCRLQDLIAPLTREEFLREYLHQKWLLQPGEPERFHSLFNWDDLNQMLAYMPLEPPRCRLMQNGDPVEKGRYTSTSKLGTRLDPPKMMNLLGMGATLVLDSVHLLSPKLNAFTQQIQEEIGTDVHINLYASWRKDTAFDLHWDRHDVLVLQIAGRKHWKVFRPTREFPLSDDVAKPVQPVEPPLWDDHLAPGSVLYLPRGWWHTVFPVDEPSLHLTVGLTSRKGIDVLDALVQELRHQIVVRQDVPPVGASEESLSGYEDALRVALFEAIDHNLGAALERQRTRKFPHRFEVNLPHGPQMQTGSLKGDSGLMLVGTVVFGTGSFHADGRDWPMDDCVKSAMLRLSRSQTVKVDEVTHGLPAAQRLKLMMLLTSLVLRGVLYALPPEVKD